ncbi:hypothetical protein TCAL_16175, partial [Tigriopus californicus]
SDPALPRFLPSQPFTPLQQSSSQYPFQDVSVDLFEEKGKYYLVLVDRYNHYERFEKQKLTLNAKSAMCLNRSAKPPSKLNPGDLVHVQDPLTKKWAETGTVITRCSSGQSYEVNINGSKRFRSRRLLRLVPEFSKTPEGEM